MTDTFGWIYINGSDNDKTYQMRMTHNHNLQTSIIG